MAHEITKQDGLVLHQQEAWHGLGTIVQDAPTPSEALQIAELGWLVDQRPVFVHNDQGELVEIPKQLANVRDDTQTVLGIVGDQYQPVQNWQLADFAETLAEQGDTVRLESAGSVRGGKSIWLLIKGESFSSRAGDEMQPYICCSNSHDGTRAVRLTPTTIRTVCSNTLNMVLEHRAAFRFQHTGDLRQRIKQAQQALGLYGKALRQTRQRIDSLAAQDVSRDLVQQFFLESYTADFGEIPHQPANDQEARQRDRAMQRFSLYGELFDTERDRTGSASRWAMFNAYSDLVQHHGRVRKADARAYSNLLGLNADRTSRAFDKALSI